MRLTLVSFICFLTALPLSAQTFTRADTLRGRLTPLRTCYDVTYYHLDIKVDPGAQTIAGSNTIQFRAVRDFDRMQIDLAENMQLETITFENKTLQFEREFGAVFVTFPQELQNGDVYEITAAYSGSPTVAKRPPWEGGLVWEEDKNGNPWVAVTVQGDGAYLWWPNKEHQSDEPDSMLLSVTVPDTLMNISNGRLRGTTELGNGWKRWDWFISYPINNYNVTLNIGKFAHFDDRYINADGDTLSLDYYVMPYNLQKAKKHFEEVKPMLACFEKYFGKYPFYRDGFKLIESPHLGMEHQTAIAYGNDYRYGYKGTSTSEVGIQFDFIIIHEAAHEWWGNNVTSKDIADMWIHESFGAYAEALYVECIFGEKAATEYMNGKKHNVENEEPIIGAYNVNDQGSGDMYPKGALMLHTLRHVIANDSLWFDILKGIQETFAYQTITTEDLVHYVNQRTGKDYTYIFDQYLRHTSIPELQVVLVKRGKDVRARYRWLADVESFRMPIKVRTGDDVYEFIHPTTEWQTAELGQIDPDSFHVATDRFYVDIRLKKMFLQPE